jgi:hypothetical protein
MSHLLDTNKNRLQPGDHIRVWRGSYYHHGIYCGDTVVVHYGGDKNSCIVKTDSLENFSLGNRIEIANHSHSLKRSEVIKRAKSRVGEDQYNLAFNNCEHFATWCKTGQSKSSQVEVVFHMMKGFVFKIAEGIYRIYASKEEKARYPEHLPPQVLILFQRFKKAYESKNVKELSGSISNDFSGDIYGKTKPDFISFMERIFKGFPIGVSPRLEIEILNIGSWSDSQFSCVVNMEAHLKFLGLATPVNWDSGKLFCQAIPEGKEYYWRIIELRKFKD